MGVEMKLAFQQLANDSIYSNAIKKEASKQDSFLGLKSIKNISGLVGEHLKELGHHFSSKGEIEFITTNILHYLYFKDKKERDSFSTYLELMSGYNGELSYKENLEKLT
jgi:hypothetical protein